MAFEFTLISTITTLDNVLLLWSQDVGAEGVGNNLLSDTVNKESWCVVKVFRGHLEDIYDLCWSCDSRFIITGSVDNSAIVWDIQNGEFIFSCSFYLWAPNFFLCKHQQHIQRTTVAFQI